MKPINCFNYTLYRSKCDEQIYKNEKLTKEIENLLSSEYSKKVEVDERIGNAISTVGREINVLHIPETHELANWIISQLMQIEEFKNKKSIKFDFIRHWANRIYKDCNGLCHTHTRDADAVAIFYLDVPENSSDLVIINNGEENTNYLNYKSEDLFNISVESGTLIIHKPDVPHAVSIHNSNKPRTCLIFEIIVVDDNYEN